MIGRRGFFRRIGTAVLGAAIALRVPQEGPLARFLDDGLKWPQALQRGDVFTIEGVHAINPITSQRTTRLQQFVVTWDVAGGSFVDEDVVYPTVRDWPAPHARIVVYGGPSRG